MALADKKPWYQSKIALFCIGAIVTFGSNFLSQWLTGQGVTPEQMDALASAQPEVAQAVDKIQNGGNILSAVGALFGTAVLVFRVWFTSKQIGN